MEVLSQEDNIIGVSNKHSVIDNVYSKSSRCTSMDLDINLESLPVAVKVAKMNRSEKTQLLNDPWSKQEVR